MKKNLLALFLLAANVCLAQFSDDFSDGDFTVSPVWAGNTGVFIINASKQLQLNNSIAATSYLSTPFNATPSNTYEWEFYISQTFSPSGGNYGKVYLVSDQADLTQSLNGYYLQFGEGGSSDAVELFKQSGTSNVSVCRATNGMIASTFSIRIKVTRDANGLWKILVDYTGGTSFTEEASGTEATFLSYSHLGVSCVYTVTNASKFFFDDFIVSASPIPDTTPPTLQTIITNSSTELLLTFSEDLDETTAEILTNYSANNNIGNPALAELQIDPKTVKLTFTSPFTNGVPNNLTISGLKDIALNEMTSTTQDFRYFVPQPAAFNDLVINELFPDPSPQIGLPAQEFVEIFNRSDKPFDLNGWKLSDPSTTATLPSVFILPGEYLIITNSSASADYETYGSVIGTSNFPTLNNSGDAIKLLDPDDQKIDSVNYVIDWYQDDDKSQGGFTLERLNPEVDTNEATNWLAAEDGSGGTPGKQNSVFGKNPDSKAPSVVNLFVVDQNKLTIEFSEEVEVTSAENTANYIVTNEIGTPAASTLLSGNKSIQLAFSKNFQNGVDNTIAISGIEDAAGNLVENTELTFRYFISVPAGAGDILINEVMADPSPVVQLPEAEFIEIVNVSENPFDLAGWKLSDATSDATLPSVIILPGEFVILTSTSNSSKFSAFGKTIGVSNFPAINNTGEPIALKDSSGITIDSVNFDLEWYQDAVKEEGGWSLERLLYNFSSTDETNWRASEDVSGGTPGKQNSVFGKNPDSKPPEILLIKFISENQIQLDLSEAVDINAAQDVSHFELDNTIGNPASAVLANDGKSIQLTFPSSFQNGYEYVLTFRAIADLAGNAISEAQQTLLYFIPLAVAAKDIIITEIMADPTPVVQLPEAEYIEIYNRSQNPQNLENWKLSDGEDTATLSFKIILPGEYWILTSTSNTGKFSSLGKTLGVINFPPLSNEGESIVLKDSNSVTIDSVNFTNEWYRSVEKEEGGWSLELIDLDNICGEENNWTSSEDEKGGTPGASNSVLANKPDLTGPELASVTPLSPNQIQLTFNEKLEKNISVTSFLLEPSVAISSAIFTDISLRTIILNLSEELQTRTLYIIAVAAIHDCSGNEILQESNTAEFALPEEADANDVVINEVLFNPRPNGVDFVEIYNQSQKFLNLKQWKFANIENESLSNESAISNEDFILPPQSHLAFTSDRVVLKNNYPNAAENSFFETDIPGLPDDEGSIALVTSSGKLIDQFLYSSEFHSPLIKDDEGVSLERISFETQTNDPDNWRSANAFVGYATPGYVNSVSRSGDAVETGEVTVSPEVISVNSVNAFAQVQYRFEQSGYVANVKVYDHSGHLVKEIANNRPVSFEGFFRWDGDTSDGSQARSGYYMIWFEVFDLNGNVKTYRKRVVIVAR